MRFLFVFCFFFFIIESNLIPLKENVNSIKNIFILAGFLDLYSFFHKERSRKYLKDIKNLLEDLSTKIKSVDKHIMDL